MYSAVSARKRIEAGTQDDPLLQLTEVGGIEFAVEFGLPREDDLQHFSAAILEVAQQADLLEHLPFEVVGLVDDQDRCPTLLRLRQHISFNDINTSVFDRWLQRRSKSYPMSSKNWRCDPGIEDVSELDRLFVQVIAQTFEHRRFSGADLAGQNHETFAGLDPVNQVGQRLIVLPAVVKKGGVRTQIEGIVFQAEECTVKLVG